MLELEQIKARYEKVGSSEIYGLVRYYLKKAYSEEEIISIGLSQILDDEESEYTTWYETYLRLTKPDIYEQNKTFKEINSSWGALIEGYAFGFLKKSDENGKYSFGKTYTNTNYPMSVANCDFECKFKESKVLRSSDKKEDFEAIGDGVIEIKSINGIQATKNNYRVNGLPLRYIFQLQYQMMLANASWGKIIGFALRGSDSEVARSRLVGQIEGVMSIKNISHLEKAKKYRLIYKYFEEKLDFEVIEFCYQTNIAIQSVIKRCLVLAMEDIGLEIAPEIPSKINNLKPKVIADMINFYENKADYIENNDIVDRFCALKSQEGQLKEEIEEIRKDINSIMIDNKTMIITGSEYGEELKLSNTGTLSHGLISKKRQIIK